MPPRQAPRSPDRRGTPRPWRLVNALVLSTSLQLSLLAAGIGLISHLNHRRSIEALATALGQSISQQVVLELDRLLQAPRLINELNRRAIRRGELDVADFAQLERSFQSQIELFPVGYINYGNEQGEYLGVERLDGGGLRLNLMQRALGPRRQLVFDLGAAGRGPVPVQVFEDIGSAREEAWYRETVRSGRPTWSSIYQWDDKPEVLSISFNEPVRDRAGRLQGVIGVDLILSQLDRSLRRIWGARPGVVLITERDGRLVASSDGRTLRRGAPGTPPQRVRIDRSPEPLVRAAGARLFVPDGAAGLRLQLPPAERSVPSSMLLTGRIAGQPPPRHLRLEPQDTFVEVIPWADRHGLDWLVLVIIPRDALAAALQPHGWLPLLLYAAALSLALLVGSRLTRWILRPLARVSEAATGLADTIRRAPGEALTFRAQLPPGSAQEIQSLGGAIHTLVTSFNGLVAAQRRSGQRLQRLIEQKERALQLSLQKQQQAEASSEARQGFLAHLGHELRAPLSRVLATTRLALRQEMPERLRSHLTSIDESTREMLRLTNDTLDFARLQTAGLELQRLPFSLAALLQDVSDLVSPQAQLKDGEIGFTILPGTPDTLVGDPRRLRQVLLNLLAAFIQARERGVIDLTVATRPVAATEGGGDERRVRLEIRVRDSGEPTSPGEGLGLSISRGLVQLMGGSLETSVPSERERTVRVTLPIEAAPGRPAGGAPPQAALPVRPVRLLGAGARAEAERLAALLPPLGLGVATERGPGGDGPPAPPPALVLVDAETSPEASAERVRCLRAELGAGVPIALLVRRLELEAYATLLAPPWDALVERPLHGPRLAASLAPLTTASV